MADAVLGENLRKAREDYPDLCLVVEANNVDSFAALPSLADAGTSPAEISILDVASKNMPPFIDTTSVLNTLMNLNNEEPGEANS